jgi:hypothetical protein
MYCVVLTIACGLLPNEYFLDAESVVNGVTSDDKMGAKFEVNKGYDRGCTQKEMTNPSQVPSLS